MGWHYMRALNHPQSENSNRLGLVQIIPHQLDPHYK